MPASHLSPDRLTRGVIAMQIEVAAAGIRIFGSYERAIYFVIVLRQGMRLLHEETFPDVRAISIHAIATIFGRPYATVYRHVQALAAARYVDIVHRCVQVTPDAREMDEVVAFLDRIRDAFVRLGKEFELDRLVASVAIHRSGDRRLMAAIDLLLCSIEGGVELEWDAMLVLGCIRLAEFAPSKGHGRAGDPASLSDVAATLEMSYSTVRRRVLELTNVGALVRDGRGFRLSSTWRSGLSGQSIVNSSTRCARKVFQQLAESIEQPDGLRQTNGADG